MLDKKIFNGIITNLESRGATNAILFGNLIIFGIIAQENNIKSLLHENFKISILQLENKCR